MGLCAIVCNCRGSEEDFVAKTQMRQFTHSAHDILSPKVRYKYKYQVVYSGAAEWDVRNQGAAPDSPETGRL
jgi:hypothetical protein